MALDIAQEQQGEVRLLGLRGRLDTDTSADLELAVQDLHAAGARDFLIDLTHISYVSSAGLRVLLALAKQLEGSRGGMRLCGLNASVMQVFEVAGFSKLFAIFKDRATALAGMTKAAPEPQPPTLAQLAARLLKVGDYSPAASPQATELARAVAQLLGVRPVAAITAAPASAARADVSAVAPAAALAADAVKPGILSRLRGLFGRKS